MTSDLAGCCMLDYPGGLNFNNLSFQLIENVLNSLK